jgi:hypothetical protein
VKGRESSAGAVAATCGATAATGVTFALSSCFFFPPARPLKKEGKMSSMSSPRPSSSSKKAIARRTLVYVLKNSVNAA